MLALLLMYVGGGVLLALLALPLYLQKIGPNPVYGFRISPAYENPKLWYPVNRYAANWLFASAISLI
ncbi:MAG: SdpI family protein, partial [Chloroflexi bacterium]|nr:SdpI family protein [Chloroflexota bacterium]